MKYLSQYQQYLRYRIYPHGRKNRPKGEEFTQRNLMPEYNFDDSNKLQGYNPA